MKLRICGMQIRGGRAEDKVEVVSVGKMYEEEGAVCVSYEEMSDANEMGFVSVVNNLLKVQDNHLQGCLLNLQFLFCIRQQRYCQAKQRLAHKYKLSYLP